VSTRWLSFDDLCLELQLRPHQVRKLIKQGKITGICFGRPSRYQTDWRFVDPAQRYKQALSIAARIQARTYEIDLAEFPVISTKEFAALCGFTEGRVRGLLLRKALRAHKIGRYSFFTANQVRDFLLRRERLELRSARPRMGAILTWVMRYVEQQRDLAMPRSEAQQDDALEGMLQQLMRLKEPERSQQVKAFWRRYQLAKDFAEATRSK